jgi:cysteine-rich repeat protein
MQVVRRFAPLAAVLSIFLVCTVSPAFAICGDAIPDPGELCDDGNLIDGDGCDSNCTPTGCGNAVTTAGEVCDDGNLVSGDGCDSNCTLTACGNGVTAGAETCDDGNLIDGDGCDSNCTLTACGNAIITTGEVCDDGNLVSGDGCDANCTATACGNGITTAPETCDDGNLVSGDGCDANCTATACGNGVTTAPETCDDGNLVSGDGCDANCTATACGNGITTVGETCDDGNLTSGDGCDANCTATACGNGVTTAPETCDDGNVVSGDGCDANCTATACGNGITTVGEACDDGNLTSGDGCDANCTATACGNGIATVGEACDDGNLTSGDGCDANCTATACGNGVTTAPETCDDGNPTDGDGCDANCTATACGNGVTTVGEACDDGNLTSGDGCDANCTVTACGNGVATLGEQCDDGNAIDGDGCDTNCTLTGCGNSLVTAPETCDDGNVVDADGCDSTCQPTGCGSGVLTGLEQCDDGNLLNGDGCSQNCEREFLNPLPSAGDHFGEAIAAVGLNLLVGSPLFDVTNAINTGRAYLFGGGTGALLRTFANPTPGAGDAFGAVVASLGSNVLIGAPLDDTAGPDAGAVYLFNSTTGALIRTFINPSPGLNDHFGQAIATLGSNILIGAPWDPTGDGGGGAAYLYNTTTGAVLQVFLNPSAAADDAFGSAIVAVGGNVLVGAPNHDRPASGVNSPAAPNAGEAYLMNPATGSVIRTFANPTPVSGDLFGASVSSLGSNALIGAPVIDQGTVSGGAVYLYDASNGNLLRTITAPTPVLNDAFGYKVVGILPDRVVISARLEDTGVLNSGAVYVYHAGTGALLDTFKKPVPADEDHFGESLAALGGRILVGTPLDDAVEIDAGAVYAYDDLSCGSGTVEGGETCDDGNVIDGDGCDSNCTVTACGNGVITAGEGCDDGNLVAGDGCSPICAPEGACGDGVTGPGELCDDGNLVSGDGCDSNCRPTGCGNGIITAGEQCDQGAANGTDLCCSATCQAVDSDLDGVCDQVDVCPSVGDPTQTNGDGDVFGDACDVCPGDTDNDSDGDGFCFGPTFRPPAIGSDDPCSRGASGTWTKPRLTFGRLDRMNGTHTMRVRASFKTGSTLPLLAPEKHGVQLRVIDSTGTIIVDEHVPGGLLVPGEGAGWRALGDPPTKWIFTDRDKPPLHNGIRKLVVKDLSRVDPNRVDVFLIAKNGTYVVTDGSQAPLSATIELNDTAFPTGGTPGRDQCGEIDFGLPPAKPACFYKPGAMDCK